jgi:hypothetical protein
MPKRINLEFERRLLEHPAAYHFRRMRLSFWLYLDLLTRLPAGQDTLAVDPQQVAMEMGLPEGTVLSWLGHLRRMKYLDLERRNGTIHVRIGRLGLPEPPPAPKPKFFTVRKLERALGERDNGPQLEEAVKYPDDIIKRALAGALAVPEANIRKSRTALFIYLLKRYDEPPSDPRP